MLTNDQLAEIRERKDYVNYHIMSALLDTIDAYKAKLEEAEE